MNLKKPFQKYMKINLINITVMAAVIICALVGINCFLVGIVIGVESVKKSIENEK